LIIRLLLTMLTFSLLFQEKKNIY